MPRAAQDVMQSVIFSAVLDAVAALKAASGGLPNNLLRSVQSIHANVTPADLPKELQDAIALSTRAAFAALLKDGYAVAPRDGAPTRSGPRQGEVVPRGVDRTDRPRGPRPDGRNGPPRGPRSPRNPR